MSVKAEEELKQLEAMPEWHEHEQLHPSVLPDPCFAQVYSREASRTPSTPCLMAMGSDSIASSTIDQTGVNLSGKKHDVVEHVKAGILEDELRTPQNRGPAGGSHSRQLTGLA